QHVAVDDHAVPAAWAEVSDARESAGLSAEGGRSARRRVRSRASLDGVARSTCRRTRRTARRGWPPAPSGRTPPNGDRRQRWIAILRTARHSSGGGTNAPGRRWPPWPRERRRQPTIRLDALPRAGSDWASHSALARCLVQDADRHLIRLADH